MRTTEVRALLPDAWGFVCPVHTPDGSPCGLLNHLAMPVELVTHPVDGSRIPLLLAQLGLIPVEELPGVPAAKLAHTFVVLLDGRLMGWVPKPLVKVGGCFGQIMPVLRICIHFIRIRIQHFRLNTDPYPGL
jgi:DNA-directed RNA polymerase I subunit RPA2